VLVRGEREVRYGRVVEAMDVARGAGADRIGIVLLRIEEVFHPDGRGR